MPNITMKMDNLNERNTEFEQSRLEHPVFLNSVPKCGTHLIRNILRMFVPVDQQYHDTFIQIPNLRQHGPRAFNPDTPKLSWGHLLFSDESSLAVSSARQILLVRDPYSWVIARARFFISENFDGKLDHLRSPKYAPEDLMNMMIFGIHGKAPPMSDIFNFNAAAWIGTRAKLYRFEDILKHIKAIDTPQADAYFLCLFADCGIERPGDWKERVLIGSDKNQSSTARDNLQVDDSHLPDELPEQQKRLVDYALPGLRRLLGYA
ncbi:MAG: hypothetical protein MRY64_09485 [Hyphomonadaceae bacterium]|nr:hypothetical protein [Hyphomonadaceae bacterium]